MRLVTLMDTIGWLIAQNEHQLECAFDRPPILELTIVNERSTN